jgi:cytochrome P450
MISDLLAGADGDTLSDHEIKSMCALMLFAGHETKGALAGVVNRLPGLRCAEVEPELRWVPSLAPRGLETLRVAHNAHA